MKLRTRIAPTPSGYLHLGNAWSFVLTWLAARSQDGFIHLRIDDLDAARARDEYVEDIFATLDWLGLDWDSGPRSAEEFKLAFSQRQRISRYRAVLEKIRFERDIYACACSREQIRRDAEAVGVVVYPGTCREKGLSLDDAEHAWRYRVPAKGVAARDELGRAFDLYPNRDMGDFVLRQKNGDPSYQLASVTDDEDLNINFIVRGLDLMPSTGAQLSLSRALSWEKLPQARFWHHSLIVDDAGGKLSKSNADAGIREKFSNPKPIFQFFARHLGMDPTGIFSAKDLLPGFRVEKVATMPLRFADFWRENGG